MGFLSSVADDGPGAALAGAEGGEGFEVLGGYGEDVAFLGLVASDFEGAEAGFAAGDGG